MGKQARLRDLRRVMRNRVGIGLTSATAAASIDRRVRGRCPIPGFGELRGHHDARSYTPAELDAIAVRLHDAAQPDHFRVGMSISGPPEAFGLPPDPRSGICSAHQVDGAYDCPTCYPPRAPVTVTAVDHETGTITLATAAP